MNKPHSLLSRRPQVNRGLTCTVGVTQGHARSTKEWLNSGMRDELEDKLAFQLGLCLSTDGTKMVPRQ